MNKKTKKKAPSKAAKTRLRNRKIRLCEGFAKYEVEGCHDDNEALQETIVGLYMDGFVGIRNMTDKQLNNRIQKMMEIFDIETVADAEEFLKNEGVL